MLEVVFVVLLQLLVDVQFDFDYVVVFWVEVGCIVVVVVVGVGIVQVIDQLVWVGQQVLFNVDVEQFVVVVIVVMEVVGVECLVGEFVVLVVYLCVYVVGGDVGCVCLY